MMESRCRKFINTGTYWQHYDAKDSYLPANLYAAMKGAFEALLGYYADAAEFHVTNLILYDTYGPHDERRKLLSFLLDLAENGGELDMSPGNQQLDFVYIDDVVEAFLIATNRALESARGVETYAVRTGRTISLRELVSKLEAILGKRLEVTFGGRPYRAREVMKAWPGPVLPHWLPRIDCDEGLRRVLAATGS
jgi:nucleoside-diphosphate-sugar epimerase